MRNHYYQLNINKYYYLHEGALILNWNNKTSFLTAPPFPRMATKSSYLGSLKLRWYCSPSSKVDANISSMQKREETTNKNNFLLLLKLSVQLHGCTFVSCIVCNIKYTLNRYCVVQGSHVFVSWHILQTPVEGSALP